MTTVWAVRPWMAERCAIPAMHQPAKRKRVEDIFGWIKARALFRRTSYRGRELTQLGVETTLED